MSTTSNLGTILRFYANRQESAFINYRDFCEYIKKYSARHLEEQPELIKYMESPESILYSELKGLSEKKEVYLLNFDTNKATIAVTSHFSVVYANKYKEILTNHTIPFPLIADLPKLLPHDAIEKESAENLIPKLSENQNLKSPVLHGIILPRDIPSILLPECVPINFLTRAATAKIRNMLKKDEYHDYFQKKLRIANPGKELASQTFYSKFLQQSDSVDHKFDLASDYFYFWSQLCYFIRQDFEKVKDRTSEDTNILQSVAISEIHMMYLKTKANKEQNKQQALHELQEALLRPPYFYSMDTILKLKDSKGALLYGQYNEDDLKDFLRKLTTESVNSELPLLLVLKTDSGNRYFISKQKVFQLVVRLTNEAHDVIEKRITNKWFNALSNYEKLPEMKDNKLFEKLLEKEVKINSPVLHSLLNANFLTLLNYEFDHNMEQNNFNIFSGGQLLPYSELLMIKNSTILSNAKTMLPFWYTIPIISWIIGFFAKKSQETPQKEEKQEIRNDIEPTRKLSKKEAIAQNAKEIISTLVPEGSTIDRELDSYEKQWNKLITKEAHLQLTEDVNALIRDYMRKVIKTISASTFTTERVQSLAEALVKTPNMQKIKDEDALYMYVQLFILRLVTNV